MLQKTLESPLDCKEINPVNSKRNEPWIFIGRTVAEAPIFGHLLQRADSLEKSLMLGKIEGRRRRGQQRMRWLEWWTGRPGMLQSMGSQRIRHDWETELNWISYTSLHLKWTCILIQQNGKFIIHLTITVNVLGGIVQSHFLISPSLWLSVAWLITFTHPQFHWNSSDRSCK